MFDYDRPDPAWVDAIADTVVQYALLTRAQSGYREITVVDLAPHRHEAAWMLQQSLERRTGLLQCGGITLQYLACSPAALMPGTALTQPAGPVVVVAQDCWKRLHQPLLSVHYGKLFEWNKNGSGNGTESWLPLNREQYTRSVLDSLRGYLAGLNSAAMTLPLGALSTLTHIAQWACHGYLVLARCEGWATQEALRLESDDAVSTERIEARDLPVNFHWLSQQVSDFGAFSWEEKSPTGDVIQLVMRASDAVPGCLDALAMPLAKACGADTPHFSAAIRASCRGPDLQAALAMLRQSGHSPAVLEDTWSTLARALTERRTADLSCWAKAVRQVWANQALAQASARFLRGIAHMAFACNDLALAQNALTRLEAFDAMATPDALLKARCLELTGRAAQAHPLCAQILTQSPTEPGALQLAQRLHSRLALQAQPWRTPRTGADALTLEPLDVHHADALMYQYRDPQIAAMTGLPKLATTADAQRWIMERAKESAAAFAVVHRELGLVGYADLHLAHPSAFLCFWIGADFQGRGFSTQAARLLCEMAFDNGMRVVLAAAFDDNVRSLRSLRSSGFHTLTIRALAPDDDRTFLYLSRTPLTEAQGARELISFYERENLDMRFPAISEPALEF